MEQVIPYLEIILVWALILMTLAVIGSVLGQSPGSKKALALGAVVIGIIIGIPLTDAYTDSQSFQKQVKSVETNFNPQNVYREMKVVSRDGDIIYKTAGHFDVDYKDDRLRWIDEDGELNLIYLGNSATVVIEEKK